MRLSGGYDLILNDKCSYRRLNYEGYDDKNSLEMLKSRCGAVFLNIHYYRLL